MTDHGLQRDSASWIFFVKISFILSVLALGLGIYFMPAELWVKGYMAMGSLFTIGTSITLSKTLRDEHEARKLINKISEAKTERILKTYDPEEVKA